MALKSVLLDWELDPLVLVCCTIGLISLSEPLFKFLKWVWSNFLRPPKKLTTYGSWALVTGCTDGKGKAITFELASKGLNLILVARNPQKLQTTSKEIWEKFGKKTQIKIIVIDFAQVSGEEIEEQMKGEIEGLDVGILVNNVGTAGKSPWIFHEFDLEEISELLRVNIGSVTWVTRAVLPGMLKRQKGAIVNIGSGGSGAIPSFPLCALYASTKAYMAMFSRSLSLEYRQYGIDIQCQTPLFVVTNLITMAIRKASLFTPTAKEYSKASTRWMGFDSICCPHWPHAFQWWLISLFPDFLVNWVCLLIVLRVHNKTTLLERIVTTQKFTNHNV